MREEHICTNCKTNIEIEKEVCFFDKYYFTVSSRENYNLNVLFSELLFEIYHSNDLQKFHDPTYIIDFSNEESICPHCKHQNHFSSICLSDQFYFFLSDYILFKIRNIVLQYTGKQLTYFFSEYRENTMLIIKHFPETYKDEKKFLSKLIKVCSIVKDHCFGGNGGGFELLNYFLENIFSETFGIVFGFIISEGRIHLKEFIKKINFKKEIKKEINQNKNELLEDLKKYKKDENESDDEFLEKYIEHEIEILKNDLMDKFTSAK